MISIECTRGDERIVVSTALALFVSTAFARLIAVEHGILPLSGESHHELTRLGLGTRPLPVRGSPHPRIKPTRAPAALIDDRRESELSLLIQTGDLSFGCTFFGVRKLVRWKKPRGTPITLIS
jgi:hypothetical protein